MIPSTYWLARKISSSSFSRLHVADQACTAAPSAIAATASVTMKTIRMAPDSSVCWIRFVMHPPQGMTVFNVTTPLWKLPPCVVATASPWHDLPPVHCVRHVLSGVNWVNALPFESVVVWDGEKRPPNVFPPDTLF